jgi:hypothetical protein
MVQTLKAANPESRSSWRGNAGSSGDSASLRTPETIPPRGESPARDGDCGPRSSQALSIVKDVSAAAEPLNVLSVRAQNVLKELTFELTGECPPKGKWVPSDRLLRKFSYRQLRVARNCGPQTMDEIVRWARLRGVIIERPLHDGKSLSAAWQDIVARSSTAEFKRVEIVEALERSIRRKNTRIPVAFQDMLVKLLKASGS